MKRSGNFLIYSGVQKGVHLIANIIVTIEISNTQQHILSAKFVLKYV